MPLFVVSLVCCDPYSLGKQIVTFLAITSEDVCATEDQLRSLINDAQSEWYQSDFLSSTDGTAGLTVLSISDDCTTTTSPGQRSFSVSHTPSISRATSGTPTPTPHTHTDFNTNTITITEYHQQHTIAFAVTQRDEHDDQRHGTR